MAPLTFTGKQPFVGFRDASFQPPHFELSILDVGSLVPVLLLLFLCLCLSRPPAPPCILQPLGPQRPGALPRDACSCVCWWVWGLLCGAGAPRARIAEQGWCAGDGAGGVERHPYDPACIVG